VFRSHHVEDLRHPIALAPIGAERVHASGHGVAGTRWAGLDAEPVLEECLEFCASFLITGGLAVLGIALSVYGEFGIANNKAAQLALAAIFCRNKLAILYHAAVISRLK
jgi:hypothetical protein